MDHISVNVFKGTSSASKSKALMFIFHNRRYDKQAAMRRQSARALTTSRRSVYAPFSQEDRRSGARRINDGNSAYSANVNACSRFFVVFSQAINVQVLSSDPRCVQYRFGYFMVARGSLSTLQSRTDISGNRYENRCIFISGRHVNFYFRLYATATAMRRNYHFNYYYHFIRRKAIN